MQEQNNTELQQIKHIQIEQLPKPNNRKKVIWAIVIVTFIIGACIFAYFYGEYKARQEYYANGEAAAYPADSVNVDGWASPEDLPIGRMQHFLFRSTMIYLRHLREELLRFFWEMAT